MNRIRLVGKVPTVDQTGFPLIGKPLQNASLRFPHGSGFSNLEKEIVLFVFVTAAVRSGEWRSVSEQEFAMIARGFAIAAPSLGLREAWILAGDKLVELVRVEDSGEHHLIPTKELMQMLPRKYSLAA